VAFEKATGKEAWRALTTREVGYAPPVIAKVAGKDQLVVWHTEAVAGLRPQTGEVIWTVAYPPEGRPQRPEVTVRMPRVSGELLFVSSYYHGALMLKFEGEKAGVLWNRKSSSKSSFNAGLHSLMTTPVLKDGFIYGVCGASELRCLKAETGERVWETLDHFNGKQAMFGSAFLTQHGEQGNEFFIWTDLGDLIIAKLSPEKYEEVSRAHLLDPVENARGRDVVWSAPAFANKCFFARNQKELICVSLAAEG
jgi:outer membrane protein assembly factor BamB